MSPPNSVPPGEDEANSLIQDVPGREDSPEAPESNITTESISTSNDNNDTLEATTTDEESSDDVEVIVPPDGGWGWVVVCASFLCNMIVDGLIYSFGTFLPPIAEEFGASKSEVAFVGSIMSGVYMLVGPFASALANRYGFRFVAILGGLLGAGAFLLSFYATNVLFLNLSYGILGGVGFGFIYVPAVITVGFYFEKWRALATCIGVCGSGIGTFVFSPISKALIDAMGWRWTLLVHSGVIFSSVLFAFVYRPLKPTKVKDIAEKNDTSELKMDINQLPTATKQKMEKALEQMNTHSHTSMNQSSINRMLGVNNNSDYPRVSDVYHTIGSPRPEPRPQYLSIFNHSKRLSVPHAFEDSNINTVDGAKEALLEKQQNGLIVPASKNLTTPEHEVNRPMYRDDIFFGASLSRLPQYTSRTSIAYNLAVTRLPTKTDIQEEKTRKCKLCPEAVRRTLATMLDYSLLRSPSFMLLAFNGFLTMMGFFVPFMFIADRASLSGMADGNIEWLVAVIGIANTFGRLGCGVLSTLPGMNALFITNVAMTIGGIATIFSGFSMSPEFQFTYCVIFGIAGATFASLRSIIVVDLLGLEKLTNAFGLLLLFQGAAAFIGAPLAGKVMEATGNYEMSFYLSGGMILLSAIICYPLNCINTWENGKKEKSVPV